MTNRVCVQCSVKRCGRGGAQLQQGSGNLQPPLSLAWPQFPLWFMQLCFYLAWLKEGGVGGAALQGKGQRLGPQWAP